MRLELGSQVEGGGLQWCKSDGVISSGGGGG